ncbi:MAG: DHH family phosphoesterase [Candidatus Diapherotrites archaeon]
MDFASFVRKIAKKKVLLLGHAGTDVDSFASAACLKLFLDKQCTATIGVPEHINQSAESLASNLDISFQYNPTLSEYDALIVLDCSSPNRFGKLEKEFNQFKGPIAWIDHHAPQNLKKKVETFVDEKAISSTEVVFQLLKKQKAKLSPVQASLLLAGIVTDSSSFLVADANTFRIVAELLPDCKRSYAEVLDLFHVRKDVSEKIASLKAAQRSQLYKSSTHVMAFAEIGSFEATAAVILVRTGADVAFAGFGGEGECRISARASHAFLKQTELHLFKDVLNPVALKLGGNAGGHAGAAGMHVPVDDIQSVFDSLLEQVRSKMREKGLPSDWKKV